MREISVRKDEIVLCIGDQNITLSYDEAEILCRRLFRQLGWGLCSSMCDCTYKVFDPMGPINKIDTSVQNSITDRQNPIQ